MTVVAPPLPSRSSSEISRSGDLLDTLAAAGVPARHPDDRPVRLLAALRGRRRRRRSSAAHPGPCLPVGPTARPRGGAHLRHLRRRDPHADDRGGGHRLRRHRRRAADAPVTRAELSDRSKHRSGGPGGGRALPVTAARPRPATSRRRRGGREHRRTARPPRTDREVRTGAPCRAAPDAGATPCRVQGVGRARTSRCTICRTAGRPCPSRPVHAGTAPTRDDGPGGAGAAGGADAPGTRPPAGDGHRPPRRTVAGRALPRRRGWRTG